MGSCASGIDGIDIEFVDRVDGRLKYCQLKAGPNTINSGDVKPIFGHFTDLINRARTNHLDLRPNDMFVGVLYGTPFELSGHYRKIAKNYDVIIGQQFWFKLTGRESFYKDLIGAFVEVAHEQDWSYALDGVITELAEQIKNVREDH